MRRIPRAGVVQERNTHPNRVPDVRTLPCPSRTDVDHGNHTLTNTTVRGNAVTRCGWCRVPWATLDAELRVTRTPAPDTVKT